jgi:GDP-L-fucose synthase
MRILLTGGTGMVGHAVREASGALAHEVLAPDRRELDLFDITAVKRYIATYRPNLVIHAAGRVGGIQANIREPVVFLVENFDMGRNIVMGSLDAGVPRLLNLASSCMYPRDARNPLREDDLLTGTLEPTNEGYALAKIAVTQLCRYVNRERRDIAYKTLIPCNLFGRYDKFSLRDGHMVAAVIAKLHLAKQTEATEVEIWGNGSARREFMYVGDLADAIWRAVEDFESLPDLVNVGPGCDHSIDDYYYAIAEVVGYRGRFVHDLSKPAGMMQKLLDVSRMTSWGFAPAHLLRGGIELTYRYYLDEVAHRHGLTDHPRVK